jgi:antitoxin component YwqK of YwqJK toxin-antitoxin module
MLDDTKKMLRGQAYYFYKNGIMSAEGVNDNEGKKTGLWTYYSADGFRTSS